MFDDILGKRPEEVKPYLGEKDVAEDIGGLKGRPVPGPAPKSQGSPLNSNKAVDPEDVWCEDEDEDEDDCSCDCDSGCAGCLDNQI